VDHPRRRIDLGARQTAAAIPVDVHPKGKIPAIELVLTNLHAAENSDRAHTSILADCTAVGAKCTTLFGWFRPRSPREARFINGLRQSKTTDKLAVSVRSKNKKTTGTLITSCLIRRFSPSRSIQVRRLAARLRELAFLNPGLEITLTDETRPIRQEGAILLQIGIEEFVRQWVKTKTGLGIPNRS